MDQTYQSRACLPEAPPPSDGDEEPGVEETLLALALAVEQRDPHIAGHCQRIAFISVSLGIAMGLEGHALLALYRGGYLHDIGKVGIPDSILLKPSALTAEEWAVMRSHSTVGEKICRPLRSLSRVLPIIRHHHERWDGTGYPDGLRGTQIPLLARVLQVADIYDALTSPRPYKPPFEHRSALLTLCEETDRGWRDRQVVELFLRLHHDVLANASQYNAIADRSLQAMCAFAGQGIGAVLLD